MDFHHRGAIDAVRVMDHLKQMVQELDKRLAADPSDADYARMRAELNPVAADIERAHLRYQASIAEQQMAAQDLSRTYEKSYYELLRGRAWAYGRFGHKADVELAAFGIPRSATGRKRRRRVPIEPQAE